MYVIVCVYFLHMLTNLFLFRLNSLLFLSACYEIEDKCKPYLEKAIFESPLEIKPLEMNAVSSAIYMEAIRPLDPDVFFEITQFYVHRMDDVDLQGLVYHIIYFPFRLFFSK